MLIIPAPLLNEMRQHVSGALLGHRVESAAQHYVLALSPASLPASSQPTLPQIGTFCAAARPMQELKDDLMQRLNIMSNASHLLLATDPNQDDQLLTTSSWIFLDGVWHEEEVWIERGKTTGAQP